MQQANGEPPLRRLRSPAPAPVPAAITGGSEVVRIYPDGHPQKQWSSTTALVYSLFVSNDGHLLAGTGNQGVIFRIDSPQLYTSLINTPPTQVTAMTSLANGGLLVATGNPGKLYQLGPERATEGTIEGSTFDAELFSRWGAVSWRGQANGGEISLQTRSGNLEQPSKNWSAWSKPITATGGRIESPAARFLQWRATLKGDGKKSPEVRWIEVAYLQKNIAPQIEIIEDTPPNYRFPTPITAAATQTLDLPALGKKSAAKAKTSQTTTPALLRSKGMIGARWLASDPNGDSMIYKVEIKGEDETVWRLLKDEVKEHYLTWDSRSFPDGEYRLRVTASDAPSNPKADVEQSSMSGDVFLVDNTPPQITGVTSNRSSAKATVRWKAADALTVITKAEYSLDGGDWTLVRPSSRLSDAKSLEYELSLDGLADGEHVVAIRVQDEFDNESAAKAVIK